MQHPPEAKASLSPPPRLDARYGIAREFCGAAADRLPDLCFGAIVSLVFNRGPAVSGKNREEMRQVRDAIRFGDDGWREVPGYIRAMKRIWKGRDIERRVLAEAVHLHLEDRVLLNGEKTVVFRS